MRTSNTNAMKQSNMGKSTVKKEFIASVTNQASAVGDDKKDFMMMPQEASPNQILKKFKNYLPARQHASEKKDALQYQNKVVLNDLESKMIEFDDFLPKINPTKIIQRKQMEVKQIQPIMQRISQAQEFKKQPLRRIETDFQMYKEIFVNPKQQMLNDLKQKQQNVEDALQDEVQKLKKLKLSKIKRSESIEKISSGRGGGGTNSINNINNNLNQSQLNPQTQLQASHKKLAQSIVGNIQNDENVQHNQNRKSQLNMSQEIKNLNLTTQQQEDQQQLQQNQDKNKNEVKKPGEASFFDQQIQVQPPDMSSMNAAAALKENSTGYPRSIPIMQSFQNANAKDIRDLLMKAKAGMQAGDLQKEAHLTFILGMVHEQNKNFKQTVRFYKKFLTCAKLLEDKIGMALAANRLGVNYYNQKAFKKSLEYNLQNLQLSDYENQYAAFYNIGICYRKIAKIEQSIEFFYKALEWAQNREEIESECLAYGQIGVNYIELAQYDSALDNLAKCYDLTLKIKNSKLQLDCLLLIIKISTQTSEQNFENIINILKDAYNCAKIIDDKKIISICLCNMGVLQGKLKFNQYLNEQQQNQSRNEQNGVEEEY